MFPFCFEWECEPGHYIFIGLLYLALTLIGSGLAYAIIKTCLDLPLMEKGHGHLSEIPSRLRYNQF